jgi:hypothetical protein
MTVIHVRADGGNESALSQLMAQHRAGFMAGVEQADVEATVPEAGSACSEFLEDEHAPTPRERARQARRLGVICLVSFVASVCFAVPLLWHMQAKSALPATKPAASFPAGWA